VAESATFIQDWSRGFCLLGVAQAWQSAGRGDLAVSEAVEVIVVGGGVIGCAVAYELAARSVPVLLIDHSLPGRATSASAGGLWPIGEAVGLGCGVIYHAAQAHPKPASTHEATWQTAITTEEQGPLPLPDVFRDFLVRSNSMFPDLAAELREQSGVDIEYAPGTGLLFVIHDEPERHFVERVARSLPPQVRLEMLSAEEAVRVEPNLARDLLGGALLTGEGQVNPMMLAEAFKRAAIRRGAGIRHHARVTSLRCHGGRIAGVDIGPEFVPCQTVVNAAGAWASELAATAGLKLPVTPVRGQIVLTETLPPTLNGCLSTSTCYLAQKAHGEVLIGSTTEYAGFDVSVTPEAIRSLCRGAARVVPLLGRVQVKRTWAGLRPGTPDELPILGKMNGVDGYVNATGGFRTGIVASPLTGKVVAQVVCGQEPCFPIAPYSADRFRGATATREGAGLG
jgi:hydrogen cyanide synthase HcnC